MAFRLIPKVFDAIDVVMLVRKELTMIDSIVLKLRYIQRIVGTIIVSIDNTIRHDLLTDDGQKGLSLGIRNHLRVDLPAPLQNAKDGHLARSSTPSFSFTATPKVGLIHFNGSRKRPFLFDLLSNDQSEPMVKVNGGSTIHIHQICSSSGRYPCYKVLKEPIRLIVTEF